MLKQHYRTFMVLLVLIIIGLIMVLQPLLANDTLASKDALFATVGSDLNHYSETDGLISVGDEHTSDTAVVIYPKAKGDIRAYAHMAFTIASYGLPTYINQYLFAQPSTSIDWSQPIFDQGYDHYILIITPDGLTSAFNDIDTYSDKIIGIILIDTPLVQSISNFDGFILSFDRTNDPYLDLSTDLAMIKGSDDAIVRAQNTIIAALLDQLNINNKLLDATSLTNVIIELSVYPNDGILPYLNDPNYAVSLVTDTSGEQRLARIEKKLKLGGEIVIIDQGITNQESIQSLCERYGAQLIIIPCNEG